MSVIPMITYLFLQFITRCLIFFLQLSNRLFVYVLIPIALFNDEVWCILYSYIVTISVLACFLQSRSITAICTAVVLPGDIIDTFRIHSTVNSISRCFRNACLYSETVCSERDFLNLNNYFSIISYLVRHFATKSINDNELTTTGYSKFIEHRLCINFYHLLTLNLFIICCRYSKRAVFCRTNTIIIETNLLTSSEQEGTDTEIRSAIGIKLLSRNSLLTYRLNISDTSVRLKSFY